MKVASTKSLTSMNPDVKEKSGNGTAVSSQALDQLTGEQLINTYKNCVSVDASSAKILRIRPIYNDVSVAVRPEAGSPLPFQSYQIGSVGSFGGVVKKVRVTKTLPSLPSIFDFGLFSGSPSNPIENQ